MEHLYNKIANDLITDIRNNTLFPGNKLPSIRSMSQKYNCSKSTVEKAYSLLIKDHYIYCKPQSGYYLIDNLLTEKTDDNGNIFDFSTGNPNMSSFPLLDLQHCLDRSIDTHRNSSLNIGLDAIDSLQSKLPEYLSKFQIYTEKKNIFVNMRILQMLSLLTEMPFPNNKNKILIEEPCYSFYIRYLKNKNIPTITINRDENGYDLKELRRIFKYEDIKFFYLAPRANNPLGTSLDSNTKKYICELADKYDVFIVEDDYFGDYIINSRNLPLSSYSFGEHTIYLKSFSKLIPWIRLGISVVPDSLIDILKKHIKFAYLSYYFSPSLSSQATLDIYLKSNLLDKHTSFVKKSYKTKLNAFQKGLASLNNLGIKTLGNTTGFYSMIIIPSSLNEDIVINTLKKKGVLVATGRSFFYDTDHYIPSIRLSFSNISYNEIIRGFEIIYNTFNYLLNK